MKCDIDQKELITTESNVQNVRLHLWSINQSINQNYLKWPKWWKPLQGPRTFDARRVSFAKA